MREPTTVSRAKAWAFADRKFYDSEDFLRQVSKGLRLRKPAKRKTGKHLHLCAGDIIKDKWGKIGVVIETFATPSAEFRWCDFIAICRQDFNPFLETKFYWEGMVETTARMGQT